MILILAIIYMILGVIFSALMENSSEPDIIEKRLVREIFIIVFMIIWLPYLIINACFPKRDIWFRKINDRQLNS